MNAMDTAIKTAIAIDFIRNNAHDMIGVPLLWLSWAIVIGCFYAIANA